MKNFTTPGPKETREILRKMKVRKSPKRVAYANLEAIRARLEGLHAKESAARAERTRESGQLV